jgi:DNA-binding response OmpR family regulator
VSQRKVLVVEDEEAIRVLIERFLTSGGYSVVSTGESTRALELAREYSPDLVLCDIAMPDMDGYSVLKALQSDPVTARLPVVFLTAQREFTERVRAFRFGVVDYMTKPFTRDLLLKKVERVLQSLADRPGVRAEGTVDSLLQDVQREARSGVLTVSGSAGSGRAVIESGNVVETTIPAADGGSVRAEFRELDLDREQIVTHDPPSLLGDPAAVPTFEGLPEVFRTVLLVDDNDIFRTYVKDVLTRRGFAVHEASDGAEGLRLALQKRPWLILTDVSMPRLDGLEMCRAVRNHSLIRHTPLIFLSGWDDYKDRYRGLEAGADEYLSKETSIRELLIRIQIVLKRYSDLGARSRRGPGMEGRIELIGMPGLLQMAHLSRLTGVLEVGSGSRGAEVRFREGELVALQVAGRSGEPALLDLLSWSEGHFSFVPSDPGGGPPLGNFSQLLLDACRRLDERSRPQEQPATGD